MQTFDFPAWRSEEKKPSSPPQARLSSPQSKRPCVRSLLLEPDMEDLLASIMLAPCRTDLKQLNGPDEEEHDDREAEADRTTGESRDALLSESIFCSGSLSALPLTQAD